MVHQVERWGWEGWEGAKSSKKTVSRNHRAAGILRSRSQDRWDRSWCAHPASVSRFICCHLALLAPAIRDHFQPLWHARLPGMISRKHVPPSREESYLPSLSSSHLPVVFFFLLTSLATNNFCTAWYQRSTYEFSPQHVPKGNLVNQLHILSMASFPNLDHLFLLTTVLLLLSALPITELKLSKMFLLNYKVHMEPLCGWKGTKAVHISF